MNLPAPDPFAPVLIWASPDYRADDWPEYPLHAFAYDDLAEHCRAGLSTRRKSYPELVQKGAITEREAAADIRGWQLLAAEWDWVTGVPGADLPPTGTLADRRAAVELALERITQRFDKGDRRHDLYRQAHLNLALRWHLHRLRDGAPAVHQLVNLTRQLREEADQARAGTTELAEPKAAEGQPQRSRAPSPSQERLSA